MHVKLNEDVPPVCLEIENLQAKEYSRAHVQLNEDVPPVRLEIENLQVD